MKKTIYTLLVATTAFVMSAKAQTIETVAGMGVSGVSGDGGAATTAKLNSPGTSAVDAAGNLYIADKMNNRIRKVDASGIITEICGGVTGGFSGDGGVATAAQVSQPLSVAVDGAGNLYIADYGNSRIRKINTSGIISTVAGTTAGFSGDGSAATLAQLSSPTDVAVDGSGNLYICDYGNHKIRKVTSSGIISTIAGTTGGFTGDGGPATAAKLNAPNGVAADGSGNVYIADLRNNRIRKVDAAGTITTIAGSTSSGYSGDGGAATAAGMNSPAFLTVDVAGNVFFSDMGNFVIRRISVAGDIETVAGTGGGGYSGDGGPATAATMSSPTGVTFDANNNLFITVQGNHVVRKVSTGAIPLSGIATVCLGNTTTLSGAVPGGLWTSGSTSVATVGAASGIVYGVTAGTANITYSMGLGIGITTVTVDPCPTAVEPNVAIQNISIYPNPTSAIFTVSVPGQHDLVSVEVTDVTGKLVAMDLRKKSSSATINIDMTGKATGTYIVKVNAGDKVYREKIVVTR